YALQEKLETWRRAWGELQCTLAKERKDAERKHKEWEKLRRQRIEAPKPAPFKVEMPAEPAPLLTILYSDPTYKKAAQSFIDEQMAKPVRLRTTWMRVRVKSGSLLGPLLFPGDNQWAYRNHVFRIRSVTEIDDQTGALLLKHYVLKQEKKLERIRRELDAFQNMEKLEGAVRETIPDSVRLFVWQRDKGQCVKCGSREKLEFDHIIPVISGGSSTERNVQLLCEPCNRSKGATI